MRERLVDQISGLATAQTDSTRAKVVFEQSIDQSAVVWKLTITTSGPRHTA
jgi:hypothetical protein